MSPCWVTLGRCVPPGQAAGAGGAGTAAGASGEWQHGGRRAGTPGAKCQGTRQVLRFGEGVKEFQSGRRETGSDASNRFRGGQRAGPRSWSSRQPKQPHPGTWQRDTFCRTAPRSHSTSPSLLTEHHPGVRLLPAPLGHPLGHLLGPSHRPLGWFQQFQLLGEPGGSSTGRRRSKTNPAALGAASDVKGGLEQGRAWPGWCPPWPAGWPQPLL